jgi:sugar phosphate permease
VSTLSVVAASIVLVLGGVVYTLAELMGGPVLGALSAEAAPEQLRGRYLSLIQLAWNISSTVAPVLFAWLLDRGAAPLWVVMLGVAAVSTLVAFRLGAVLPHAAAPVTNRVEPIAA